MHSQSVEHIRKNLARKSAILDSKYRNNLKHEQVPKFQTSTLVQWQFMLKKKFDENRTPADRKLPPIRNERKNYSSNIKIEASYL